RRRTGLATVTRVPLLASAGYVVNRQSPAVHAVNGITFSERQIEIAGSVESNCPGTVQRCATEPRAIWCGLPFSSAAESLNDPCRKIDSANTVVPDVTNEKPVVSWIHCNAVRLAQLCAGRWAAVPRESGAPRPCECGDHAGLRVHFADDVVVA